MEPLQPGDPDPPVLGEYTLLGRLGEGGMGVVYLARSPGERKVAIKMVRPELARDPEFRARFAREVDTVRKVSGLYTAAIVDAALDGPVLYLVTVFIDGPTLAESVAENGPLPVVAVRSLAAGLVEGLRAIHSLGIVHRDLKPGNVMLAADGPRLIDFGIARALEGTAYTSTGGVLGTLPYMSPEQVTGGEVGPPSDVFSLGTLLAFAASGRHPFGEGTPAALIYRIPTQPADTSGVPPEICPLIDRCLAKDPGQRPATGDLLAELGGTNAPGAPFRHPAGRTAGPEQAGEATEPGGSGPGAPAVSEPVKSPAEIARELRAAAPAGAKPDQAEDLASLPGLPGHDTDEAHDGAAAGQVAWPVPGREARRASKLDRLRRGREERPVSKGERPAQAREVLRAERRVGRLAEIKEYGRYRSLEWIHTAPELAECLRSVAAQAEREDVSLATVSTAAVPADIAAVRAGRLIPDRELLDAFLVSAGFSPEHLAPFHDALDKVRAATVGVIDLRTRAIELARTLDHELEAEKRRQSSNSLIRARARLEDRRRDPDRVKWVRMSGQLYGLLEALIDDLGRIIDIGPWEYGRSSLFGPSEPRWLYRGAEDAREIVAALAAQQVDASGVDLTSLSLREPDAITGVIWTKYTRWPPGTAPAIRERSIPVGDGACRVM